MLFKINTASQLICLIPDDTSCPPCTLRNGRWIGRFGLWVVGSHSLKERTDSILGDRGKAVSMFHVTFFVDCGNLHNWPPPHPHLNTSCWRIPFHTASKWKLEICSFFPLVSCAFPLLWLLFVVSLISWCDFLCCYSSSLFSSHSATTLL